MRPEPWSDAVERRIAATGLAVAAILTVVLIVAQALR
jgi:hypothetical protein